MRRARARSIPAAGSEASHSCVITNEEGMLKRALNMELNRPAFAIMNPELTFSFPPYQTACGVAEIMWASTLAHNNLLSTGRIPDFGSHQSNMNSRE